MSVAITKVTMAEKQSSKNAVKKLLEGRLDPNTRLAQDLAQAVEERVLKNTAFSETPSEAEGPR
jgi:hypothetical protein